MLTKIDQSELDATRQIYKVLVMHFIEGKSQAEIAKLIGVSHPKVNRMIKQGRTMGMVDIQIRSPFRSLFDLEHEIAGLGGLDSAVVAATISEQDDVNLASVAEAAAKLFLSKLKDGDIVTVSGGKSMSAFVAALKPEKTYNVVVVPATGCLQGNHFIDVNHVTAQMAEALGGRSYQLHAPIFAESTQQRDMLKEMRQNEFVLEMARRATIAVVGIGSILTKDSSYYSLHPTSQADRKAILQSGATGELLAHLIEEGGQACGYALNDQLVSLTLDEFRKIPFTIGVAAGKQKVLPIRTILKGDYINALVTDENTCRTVLQTMNEAEK